MSLIGRRLALIALLDAAVLAGLMVATALGGTGLKTKSATVTVEPGGSDSVTATCKKGTKAVSGGFEAEFDPDDPGAPQFVRIDSWRTGGRKWTSGGSY